MGKITHQIYLAKTVRFTSPNLLCRSAEFTPQDKFRSILLHPLYLDLAVMRADFDFIAGFDLVA